MTFSDITRRCNQCNIIPLWQWNVDGSRVIKVRYQYSGQLIPIQQEKARDFHTDGVTSSISERHSGYNTTNADIWVGH